MSADDPRAGSAEGLLFESGKHLGADTQAAVILKWFLAYSRASNKPSTYSWYRFHLEPFAEWLGPVSWTSLKPIHVTLWLQQRFPNTTNGSTLNAAARAITRPFAWAEAEGLISRSPFKGMRKPRPTRRESDLRPDQVGQILGSAKAPLVDFLIALVETGCRPQEAREVEAQHVHEDCWVLPIHKSKGGKERRVILLTERVTEITSRLVAANPKGPIFRNTRGKPWTKNALILACHALRLPFAFSPYHLRHYFCTQALVNGVDPVTVSKLMGHADTTMVSRVYSHLEKRSGHLKEALRKAVFVA